MSSFSQSHNIVKRPAGNWRSIHGYGAAHLVNGRFLLCGYDISLHLWRDAKYDGILEANGIPFRIEIKSTGQNKNPLTNPKAEFTFTSGGRAGRQINRHEPSREQTISTDNVDFIVGVSSHDTTLWIVPAELLNFLGNKIKIPFSDIFKEKVGIFLGIDKILDSQAIRNGFLNLDVTALENICDKSKISITNSSASNLFNYPWQTSSQKTVVQVSYTDSLVLDIWKHILHNTSR